MAFAVIAMQPIRMHQVGASADVFDPLPVLALRYGADHVAYVHSVGGNIDSLAIDSDIPVCYQLASD